MTSWYRAICDEHKEYCDIFVVNWGRDPSTDAGRIAWPLGNGAAHAADEFLSAHWACKLRLVRDDNEDNPKDYVDKSPP